MPLPASRRSSSTTDGSSRLRRGQKTMRRRPIALVVGLVVLSARTVEPHRTPQPVAGFRVERHGHARGRTNRAPDRRARSPARGRAAPISALLASARMRCETTTPPRQRRDRICVHSPPHSRHDRRRCVLAMSRRPAAHLLPARCHDGRAPSARRAISGVGRRPRARARRCIGVNPSDVERPATRAVSATCNSRAADEMLVDEFDMSTDGQCRLWPGPERAPPRPRARVRIAAAPDQLPHRERGGIRLATERVGAIAALTAQPGLQRPGRVVQARVDGTPRWRVELPQPGRGRSCRAHETGRPRRASSRADARPTTPAPLTTIMSGSRARGRTMTEA